MRNEGLKILNFFRGYLNNFEQGERDFCLFFKAFGENFSKKYAPICFAHQKRKKKDIKN